MCSKVNKWSNATKALKLPTLLEGEALAAWLELSKEQRSNYEVAKQALVGKMMPVGFKKISQFTIDHTHLINYHSLIVKIVSELFKISNSLLLYYMYYEVYVTM